ncbi:MAG: sulfatase [Planctomycetota bacterium]
MVPALRRAVLAALVIVTSSFAQDQARDGAADTGDPRRPNIVFVFSDDHAVDAIGAYRGRFAGLDPTPNIDRLASMGAVFENSFCTNSICGPSRAVILTGLHSHLNGVRGNGRQFDGDQWTFPKALREVGYQTALFGKWHLGSSPQGFDAWEVLPGQGEYYNPRMLSEGGERRIDGHVSDIVTDLSIDWIREAVESGDGAPFLLMCQHKAPHRNWMPAPRHLDLYDDVEIPEPASLFDDYRNRASPAAHQEMEIGDHMSTPVDLFVLPLDGSPPDRTGATDQSGLRNLGVMTVEQRAAWDAAFVDENREFLREPPTGEALIRWKYQRYAKNYLRAVRGVDDSVGRLMATLDELGIADNTIFVYGSDQGFYLGEHGWFDKRWMYEQSMRMPLIVRWPGHVEPGRRPTELVQNLDYAPTFLDAAGAQIPDQLQGRTLRPLLEDRSPEGGWRDAVYFHYHAYPSIHMVARHYGVRTERYKLIRYYQFDEWELFDLQQDPMEMRNLYGDPEHFRLCVELAELLGQMRAESRDDSDLSVMPREWQEKYR